MDAALNESLRAAEQSVLGSVFIDPDCAGEVMSRVKPADFIEPEYRALFEAARQIQDEGGSLDVVTVLARAGGAYRELARECMDLTPTAANVLEYCRVLREQAVLHRLWELSTRLMGCRDLSSARSLVEQMTGELGERTDMPTRSWPELMADFLRRQSEPEPEYIKFGLDFLDSELFIEPGSFVILAARPGVGKTALALQMALKMAERHRVGYYSLEMRDKAIADRAMAAQFGLQLRDIKRHKIQPDTLAGIAQAAAASRIGRLPFEFVEASGKTVADIRQKALARRHEIVIVDYVQLLEAARDLKNPVQELAEISKGLRSLAATGCVVIGLMQLRRPETGKETSYPTMNEIKGSGQFEQDADAILLMGLSKEAKNARVLVLDKNRDGEGKQNILATFTAGDDGNGFAASHVDYLCKILHKTVQGPDADRIFAYVARAPLEEDGSVDYTSPRIHRAANPAYGITIKPDDMLASSLQAKNNPKLRKEFLTRSLNVFVNSKRAWFDVDEFRRSDIKYGWTPAEARQKVKTWYGGADLSKLHDLTAGVLVGEVDDVLVILPHCWFPVTAAIEKADQDQIPLFGWAEDGWLDMSNDASVNHGEIVRWFKSRREDGFNIRQIGHDRKFARDYFSAMKAAGFTVVDQPQLHIKKNEGFRYIEAKAKNGQLYYFHAEPFEYCVSNVHAVEKADDAVQYDKIMPNRRIDVFDAAVFAVVRMLEDREKQGASARWLNPGVPGGRPEGGKE